MQNGKCRKIRKSECTKNRLLSCRFPGRVFTNNANGNHLEKVVSVLMFSFNVVCYSLVSWLWVSGLFHILSRVYSHDRYDNT